MTDTVRLAATAWAEYRRKLVSLDLVAKSTWNNQTAIADTICRHLGDHALDQLRKSHIEIFVGERLQSCCPVTVRGELNVLRQILNWCVDEAMLLTKPRLPTVQVPNVEKTLPSDDAFQWVLAHLRPPHSLALEFMMLTGLSPHELERLQVQDYRGPVLDALPVVAIGKRPNFPVKQPSRRRYVPLNERALQIWVNISYALAPLSTVFPAADATARAINRLVAEQPAGVDHISPKMARKWFASKIANDQPEHVLQRLLGHAPGSPITRRHYVRSSESDAASAVEGLKA